MYVICFTRPRYQVSVYRTIGPLVKLADNKECIISWMCLKLGQFGPQTTELAALEHLKTPPQTYNWKMVPRLFSYLRSIQNSLITLVVGSQVSDRCRLGYL